MRESSTGSWHSELYPGDKLSVARAGHAGCVRDVAEAGSRVAEGVERRRRQRIAGRGGAQRLPVEDVEELRADVEREPLVQPELAADIHRLASLVLPAIVVEVYGARSPRARGSIHPRRRIQNHIL